MCAQGIGQSPHWKETSQPNRVFEENVIKVLSRVCSECRETAKDRAIPWGRLAGALLPFSG